MAECCFCGEVFDEADDQGLTFVVIPTREVEGVWGKTKIQLHCHVECLAGRVRDQDAAGVRRVGAGE
jgi:hypothetical protein